MAEWSQANSFTAAVTASGGSMGFTCSKATSNRDANTTSVEATPLKTLRFQGPVLGVAADY